MNISFLANQTLPFWDGDLDGKGVGGSEAALINLTRKLAGRGHRVTVYNRSTASRSRCGVDYVPISVFDERQEHLLLVLFRTSYLPFAFARANRKIFWSTDIDWADWDRFVFPYADRVLCMSPFHQEFLCNTYEKVRREKVHILPLGINAHEYLGDASRTAPKPRNSVIFCSVPERGLEHLARLWPEVIERVPDAELHITSDYSLWGREPGTERYRGMFSCFGNVYYHGTLPRAQLVELQSNAKVMAYPCTYHEGFCLAALECIAAGAVPVTTNDYALTTTVANAGILIDGKPGSERYDRVFIEGVVRLLKDSQFHAELVQRGRERVAQHYTWDKIAVLFEQYCRGI